MVAARHIPLSAQPEMPWANGGGTTRQVAIDPPGASLASGCRWRVSRARVARDGPFSVLPGVDRSLWLLRGAGMRLSIDGREVVLDHPFQRVDFPGEANVNAHLLGGPIDDLNVMVTRGLAADASLLRLGATPLRLPPASQRLVLVLEGEVAAEGLAVAANEAALLERGAVDLVGPGARVLVLEVR